jgi:DNA repair protein RadC
MKYLRKLNIQLVKGEYKNPVKGQVRDPKQIYEVFKALKDNAQETLIGVYLDAQLEVNIYDTLSVGNQRETWLHPSEIFGRAFVLRSKYIILIHNHPSGNPKPSPEDKEAIKLLIKQARIMEMYLLDFIIVGEKRYWSMFEAVEGGEYSLGAVVDY